MIKKRSITQCNLRSSDSAESVMCDATMLWPITKHWKLHDATMPSPITELRKSHDAAVTSPITSLVLIVWGSFSLIILFNLLSRFVKIQHIAYWEKTADREWEKLNLRVCSKYCWGWETIKGQGGIHTYDIYGTDICGMWQKHKSGVSFSITYSA